MLVLASLSGIQDFLFDVRDSGGKQARSLRFRSFRIQLIAECVALRLLDALRRPGQPLPYDRLIYSAAGNVCLDAGGTDDAAPGRLRAAIADMERRLLRETHGRLRLAVAIQPSTDGFPAAYQHARELLPRQKLRSWSNLAVPASETTAAGAWPANALIVPAVYDADREAEDDAQRGERVTKARWLSVWCGNGDCPPQAEEILGLLVDYPDQPPSNSARLLSCSNLDSPTQAPPALDRALFHERRLARYIPRNKDGTLTEFVELAAEARGVPMLGVLKADVDSLGAAVSSLLGHNGRDGRAALRGFSQALDGFFAVKLQQQMRAAAGRTDRANRWDLIYTVFAGGDDMLLVGPWDVMLDFAGHMQRLFDAEFGARARQRPSPGPLTISAGVAIIKPKYPVHLAAGQAEDLLQSAKADAAVGATGPKDQCAALGQLWKWQDHEAVIAAGKKLADWVDTGVIRRGWLHTVLQLALLRHGEAGPEYAGVPPQVATSRLVYHVARNWPKARDANDAATQARRWIDNVVQHFDDKLEQAPPEVRYLPAILRYAILATRSREE